MKKFFKGLLFSCVAIICVFSFSACGKTPVSSTTVDTSKVASVNDKSTNGGITAIYDGYLYFINGTKTNDGTSGTGNTRGAICRVKINQETGEIDESTYEIIVNDLVGYANGSLYFFGDYMYYTTPSSDVNFKDNVLYYKTKFMRYDLVNKVSYNIYTTKQNESNESISYAYYVVGQDLNLVVYEKSNETITSIKINEKCEENYVISGVKSCVLSETNGKSVSSKTDANNFVFYTTSNKNYDRYQTGVKVYKTSPVTNNSVCLSDEGLSISLVSIRAGKLIFSLDSKIYCQEIDENTKSLNTSGFANVISYVSYDDIVFVENKDGSISILYFDTKTYQVVMLTWTNGTDIVNNTICELQKFTDFSFVTLATITEEVEVPLTPEELEEIENGKEEGSEGEGSEGEPSEPTPTTKKVQRKVEYIVYVADDYVYKLEIMRENDEGEMEVSTLTKPVKLSTTKVQDVSGMLVPEVIGNYLYIYVDELDSSNKETGHVYLYRMDMTLSQDATKTDKPTLIGKKESGE